MAKSRETNQRIRNSRKRAYAKGYLTGLQHGRTMTDSRYYGVRYSARRGYRKGLNTAHFENKQRQTYRNGN